VFNYITNVNKRSKRIKLQFCSYRGLIISSPKKLSAKRLDTICIEHQDWIKTQQLKYPIKISTALPEHLNLTALEKAYEMTFINTEKSSIQETENHLVVSAKNQQQQIKVLKKWMRKKAQKLFDLKLKEWSKNTQLHYSKLSVRSQKSRWGSCSSTGTISLNDQLLFMPLSVLDYIIVHELCHTLHPNHSSRYWSLVNTHYPNFKHEELLLAQYAKKIPRWFRASLYR